MYDDARMSPLTRDACVDNSHESNRINENKLQLLFKSTQQVSNEPRLLATAEVSIVKTINNCLRKWYEPWKETFMTDGREFKIVYDLMEDLLHYEYQITNSDTILSNERLNAIAQAVARLVDYGNAILNIDLLIRANDETSSEIDPNSVTTIELFKAHIRAHNLREKLLYDYFRKDKPSSVSMTSIGVDDTTIFFNGGAVSSVTPLVTLQVPSPSFERVHRPSIGSNTSINTLSDGRRTPQPHISPLPSQIEIKLNSHDLTSRIEVKHMTATIRSSAFTASHSSATRLAILPGILAKIESLLTLPTSCEKMTNCFELLDTLLDAMEKLPFESKNQEVTLISTRLLKPIVRKVYIDDRDSTVEFQHAHWTTCLLSLIRLITADDFNNDALSHFSNQADLGEFLNDYLFIVKRLMSTNDAVVAMAPSHFDKNNKNSQGSTYPSCWIEMNLRACRTFLTSLTHLHQVLRELFASKLEMWKSFIDCFIQFILHEALSSDRLMLKNRQRLLADDLRQTSAEYVWISWDFLSLEQKQLLLEDLLEPLLRACMVLRSKQRSILLPIFYDMMRCDYTSQYITPRSSLCGSANSTCSSNTPRSRRDLHNTGYIYEGDLHGQSPMCPQKSNPPSLLKTVESLPYLSGPEMPTAANEDGTVLTRFTHLIVGKLNTLMLDLNLGDECFKDELCAAIAGELNPKYYNRNSFQNLIDTKQFKCMAKHTSDLIAEFIQICLDSRKANQLSYKHIYLLCLFKLILFFRDKVDRVELYLSNLYKLCYLHHTTARYAEAGYTLLEHAKSLPWSNEPIESHYRIVLRFFQTNQPLTDYSSLKIFLYTTILEYFDQGQLWEAAIPICRELIDVYQFRTYQYTELAEMLQRMSTYVNYIVNDGTQRSNPEYFRVTFYGIGFQQSIRNNTMVYRGKPFEKLGDFQSTMLAKYPDARLLTSLAKPDESILNEPDARYLQINACTPIVNLKSRFEVELSQVNERILTYYRYNECDKFSFTRRISKPQRQQHAGNKSDIVSGDNFANMWRERTILTTNTLPGILPFFPVYLIETSIVSPIESAIEDLERTNDRLSCMVNRFKADKRQTEDIRLLGQLLLGIVDAAVNGGITKYEEAFFSADRSSSTNNNISSNLTHDNGLPSGAQVDKLKCLIAQQVPLLDQAIRLHRDRVADVMRPQHDHLESSYKKLKHHVMSKYSRYLPSDYSRSSSTIQRSYRSLARSPNRSIRSESRLPFMMSSTGRLSNKRLSDTGLKPQPSPVTMLSPSTGRSVSTTHSGGGDDDDDGDKETISNIPYQQLGTARRSLPFMSLNLGGKTTTTSTEDPIDEGDVANSEKPSTSLGVMKIDRDQEESATIRNQRSPIPAPRNPVGGRVRIISQEDDGIYLELPQQPNTRSSSPLPVSYGKDHGDDHQQSSSLANSGRRQLESTLPQTERQVNSSPSPQDDEDAKLVYF